MAARIDGSWTRERRWNEWVLGLIAAATVVAALIAVSQGPDWVDVTRRFGYWTSGRPAGAGPIGEVGAIAGLAGLLFMVVPGTVIGASPLQERLRGLTWLIAAVATALVVGSGYAGLVHPGAGDLLGAALGLAVTVGEVAFVALVGYLLGSALRRRPRRAPSAVPGRSRAGGPAAGASARKGSLGPGAHCRL